MLSVTLLTLTMVVATGQGQEAGKSSGALIVGSSKLTLAHVYAFAEKGDDGKEQYRLLITDKPLPPSAAKDEFERKQLLLERKVQGIEIVVDGAKNVVSANLYHPDLPASSLAVSGVNVFQAEAFDGQKISGTVFSERPLDHFGKRLEYRATVSAPVMRRPPITAADLESPPGKAAAAFLKAAAAADAKGLRALLTADAAKELDGPDGKEILKMLPALVPRTMKITSIDSTGDSAIIIAEDGQQKLRFRVVRQNGQWKATLPEG